MKIVTNVPNVRVINNGEALFEIKSMQYLDEQEDKVILRCAEHLEFLKRGFTCDLELIHQIHKFNALDEVEYVNDKIIDLVLVHVNRTYECDSFPYVEYVFYK